MMFAIKKDDAAIGMVALGLATFCVFPAASAHHREAMSHFMGQRITSVTNFAPNPQRARTVRPALTAQQMVTALRDGGMPISAIAEAARVERKTVYAWLQGAGVRSDNTARLEAVHTLMTGVDGVDVRNVYRFWHSKVDGQRTLRGVMTSDDLGSRNVRNIVMSVRPAALKAIETERKMARPSKTNAALDGVPEAVPLR